MYEIFPRNKSHPNAQTILTSARVGLILIYSIFNQERVIFHMYLPTAALYYNILCCQANRLRQTTAEWTTSTDTRLWLVYLMAACDDKLQDPTTERTLAARAPSFSCDALVVVIVDVRKISGCHLYCFLNGLELDQNCCHVCGLPQRHTQEESIRDRPLCVDVAGLTNMSRDTPVNARVYLCFPIMASGMSTVHRY